MENLKTILKNLKIKKELKTSVQNNKTIYYFEGSEDSLHKIELKLFNSLEASKLLKNLQKEIFTNSYGRLSFELTNKEVKHMNFKEILNKANEHNIEAWKLLVAVEVEYFFNEKEYELSDEEFELVSNFVYEWIISCEARPYEVLERLYEVVTEDDYYKFSNIDYYWNDLVEEINRMF